MLNTRKIWGYLFLFVLSLDVISLFSNVQGIHRWLKPLLMPLLLLFLVNSVSKSQKYYWLPVALALITAWFGDVSLLFEHKYPLFFIIGLSAFLLTHILYIVFFKKIGTSGNRWWKDNFLKWGIILAYGILLVAGLWPYLGNLKLPVLFYACTISVMVIMSLKIQVLIPADIRISLGLGAFLFLISDSILALNKFVYTTYFGGGSVMLTYGLAQYFIVLGTVKFCEAISDVNEAPAV